MSQNKTITLLDIKQALKDSRFRDTLPPDMMEEVHKFLKNPGCACNMPLYRKILSECSDQIKQYFPNREISNIQEEVKKLAQNKFSVINCSVDDLEGHLRKLGVGRKQIAISRYEDQVTVIVNDLDVIY
jgi:hypothetical protein